MNTLLITGTDTEAGKTVFTTALAGGAGNVGASVGVIVGVGVDSGVGVNVGSNVGVGVGVASKFSNPTLRT